MGLGSLELSRSRVISYGDIGFLYSLLSVAYKKKKDIGFTKWSSKLENQFVNNNYKSILQTLDREREARCFLPIINKVYDDCYKKIRSKILIEVVSSFDRCPFSIIEELTGLDEGKVRLFVKHNNDCPFLFDPVTSSVVYRKSAPLFKELNKLYNTLRNKFNEEVSYAGGKLDSDDEERGMHPLGRTTSGGRGGMGGMGGLGGLGGLKGMGLGSMGMGRRRDF